MEIGRQHQMALFESLLGKILLFIGGKPLHKGCRGMMQEGGVSSFIAEAPGYVRETQWRF